MSRIALTTIRRASHSTAGHQLARHTAALFSTQAEPQVIKQQLTIPADKIHPTMERSRNIHDATTTAMNLTRLAAALPSAYLFVASQGLFGIPVSIAYLAAHVVTEIPLSITNGLRNSTLTQLIDNGEVPMDPSQNEALYLQAKDMLAATQHDPLCKLEAGCNDDGSITLTLTGPSAIAVDTEETEDAAYSRRCEV